MLWTGQGTFGNTEKAALFVIFARDGTKVTVSIPAAISYFQFSTENRGIRRPQPQTDGLLQSTVQSEFFRLCY